MADNPYDSWLNSELGQNWNRAQESAAAYARKMADSKMENDKRDLDIKVMALKQQGKIAEAEIALKKGDQQIARDRLAAETRIREAEVQISRERLGLDTELGRARLGLDTQNLGLQRANAFAQFNSGPDMMFIGEDWRDAMARVGQGLSPQAYGSNVAPPKPRTYEQFEAIAGPYTGDGMRGYTPPATAAPAAGGEIKAGGGSGPVTDANGDGVPDPREKALMATIKATPLTDDDGMDASNQAALAAVMNIMKLRKPGTAQKLASRPGLLQGFAAGASKAGYFAPDVLSNIQSWNMGQGRVNAA